MYLFMSFLAEVSPTSCVEMLHWQRFILRKKYIHSKDSLILCSNQIICLLCPTIPGLQDRLCTTKEIHFLKLMWLTEMRSVLSFNAYALKLLEYTLVGRDCSRSHPFWIYIIINVYTEPPFLCDIVWRTTNTLMYRNILF